jgi:uncharacterized membrane protein YqaE (UPF0057 family)
MAYGGFKGLLDFSIAIRSGKLLVNNRFSFFQKFGQFSIVLFYFFYALFLDERKTHRQCISTKVGFFISLIFALYYIYSRAGRGGLVFSALTIIIFIAYYYSKSTREVYKRIILRIGWLPFLFIFMTQAWNRSSQSNFLALIVQTISHPFAAFFVNLRYGETRFFIDFLQSPFYFLPSSIWSSFFKFKTSNAQTTYLISGAFKGEYVGNDLVTGTTPNDLVTFAFTQGNIFGVLLIGFGFGFILKYVHEMLINSDMRYKGIQLMLYANIIVRFSIGIVFSGDPVQVMVGNWGFFIFIALLKILTKLRTK